MYASRKEIRVVAKDDGFEDISFANFNEDGVITDNSVQTMMESKFASAGDYTFDWVVTFDNEATTSQRYNIFIIF